MKMPVLYIPHGGGPWHVMQWDPPDLWNDLRTYLSGITSGLPEQPTAILVVTAHWEQRTFTLQGSPQPPMLYDYGGFPPETYEIKYPAPGQPELAARAASLLQAAGLEATVDDKRGFDHGTFVPMMVMFPEARIPVVQMSIMRKFDPALHIAAGAALQALRDEGVLIVASGMSYHHLGNFFGGQGAAESVSFDNWLSEAVQAKDSQVRAEKLSNWSSAPAARACHPREEHLIPLMVAAGAAGADTGKKVFEGTVFKKRISGFQFG